MSFVDLKKSYVDVFKSSGASSLPPPETFSAMPPPTGNTQMNYFIPQPMANANAPTDFLTPAGQPENASQVS